jgi:hypothetical protein
VAETPPSCDESAPCGDPSRYSDVDISEILARRATIEQAKGVLMHLYGVDADHAFDMLRSRSRASRIPVRELAKQILDDPRLPRTLWY